MSGNADQPAEPEEEAGPRPLGLIKFFSREQYLQDLLDGKIYANTPRCFRRLEAKGIGDPNESVALGWHDGLGPADWVLEIDGRRLTDVTSFEVRFGDRPDFYLQSWMILEQPTSDEHLVEIKESITRLRDESGPDFAILPGKNIPTYMERIDRVLDGELNWGTVEYSDEILAQSPLCKRTAFRYQKEFRFLLGECGNGAMDPLVLQTKEPLADLIFANQDFTIQHTKLNKVILRITKKDGFTSDIV